MMSTADKRVRVVRLLPVLDFGGVESRAVLLAELLDRERFALRVCTFWREGAAAEQIRALGIPVDVLGVDPSIRNMEASLALARYLSHSRVDVLHASIGEANFHSALVGKLAGASSVIIEEAGIPNRRLFARLVHALLYRRVDRLIGVSDASCRYLVEREAAPAKRVTRIYNTVNPSMFAPLSTRSLGLRCVSVGRLVEVKNQVMLLHVIHALRRAGIPAQLRIVGDGPLRQQLEEVCNALGLEDAVELCGFRDDISAILDDADLFLLPSYSEGFGLALVEAMARGCSVLATKIGGPAEILAPLGQDRLLDPRDQAAWVHAATRELTSSLDERHATRLAMRARAEDFSPRSYIDNIERLYLEIESAKASQ